MTKDKEQAKPNIPPLAEAAFDFLVVRDFGRQAHKNSVIHY